jgi:hypothetical protein
MVVNPSLLVGSFRAGCVGALLCPWLGRGFEEHLVVPGGGGTLLSQQKQQKPLW